MKPVDPKGTCFCHRSSLALSVVSCSNQLCSVSEFHPSCLKITSIQKNWLCPLFQKSCNFPKKNCKPVQQDILQRALKLDTVWTCEQRALRTDTLLECHSDMSKWKIVFTYSVFTTNACQTMQEQHENVLLANHLLGKLYSLQFKIIIRGEVMCTGTSFGDTERLASLCNLTNRHYQLILSPTGWLDCDIIHHAHTLLRAIDLTTEGLQRPTLGPCRNFGQVSGQFI